MEFIAYLLSLICVGMTLSNARETYKIKKEFEGRLKKLEDKWPN